ncbi:hypothetical protein J4Q44_G00250460 [Coregonus suidteri]|uniref:Uncharacterized protein n=1 Tax=Coregonus suidteri TaxID=861788 RepID=A0AAN8QH00_9TELE
MDWLKMAGCCGQRGRDAPVRGGAGATDLLPVGGVQPPGGGGGDADPSPPALGMFPVRGGPSGRHGEAPAGLCLQGGGDCLLLQPLSSEGTVQ